LIDGDEFFDEMLNSIHSAESFIYLEMYLVQSGHIANKFIDALITARNRGVIVKLLLDDYGARGFKRSDRNSLQAHNITICFYNPLRYGRLRKNLFRDHRKLLLVDGVIAYTGGAGITDDFDRNCNPQSYWHEAMIKISGDCVLDWKTLFEANWHRCSGELLQTPVDATDGALPGQLGRVVEGRSITRSEVIRSFVTRIRGADKHIWLASAYFVPSRKIRGALLRQAADGVDVRLLLPGPIIDHPWARHMGRRYYDRLLSHGVRIFEYQPRFTHMKILLCDHWVSIGSSNFDRWNFKWSLEANQEVDDREFALIVQRQFEKDFSDCREIVLQDWLKRSWWTRLKIKYWAAVVSILSWLSFNTKD
jgi:phosphatidylserine/phosphatidylglycerophosphate/cardiolipin synthase-like enzyme